jgi:hypothetical protein
MKRIITVIFVCIITLGMWVTFLGFSEGIESASSGNYITVDGQHTEIELDKKEFSVVIEDTLFLNGTVSDPFAGRTTVTLKLTGSRNRSLYFGADPLPTPERIADIVEEELIALGAPRGVELAIITLPLEN